MSKPKNDIRIAVSSPSFCKSPTLIQELKDLGYSCTLNLEGVRFNEEELIDFINFNKATILIVGLEVLTRNVLTACPTLKLVAKYGVGLDNIDTDLLKEFGITLGWTGGVNRRSVSELALGFMLGHLRNITPSIINMKENKWTKNGGRELSDCTVGIVGFGNIGTDLAKLLGPFGCRIQYCDIIDRSEVARTLNATALSYEDLLRTSDVISFHVPSTPQTRQMFRAEHLKLLKPDAMVVNTARGDILDFDAISAAVEAGQIGAFATDVFPKEPCDLSTWSRVPHLYFTPHMGGNSREAVLAMGRSALHHVRQFTESTEA